MSVRPTRKFTADGQRRHNPPGWHGQSEYDESLYVGSCYHCGAPVASLHPYMNARIDGELYPVHEGCSRDYETYGVRR